jgi:hypothetical protein
MKKLIGLIVIAALAFTGCSDEGITTPDADPTSAAATGLLGQGPGAHPMAASATYSVTIENLTSGQPFTPPVVATHRPATEIFHVDEPASFGVKEIAENGNLTPLVEALQGDKHVADHVVAVAGSPPPVLPGKSVDFYITAERGAKYLSFASMLICTNDGFTGADTQRLPKKVGDMVAFETDAYDAGTEINTEDFADIVPPCQGLVGVSSDDPGTGMSNPDLAEDEVIRHHPGIRGDDDLVANIHGWTDPVARITIKRTQ